MRAFSRSQVLFAHLRGTIARWLSKSDQTEIGECEFATEFARTRTNESKPVALSPGTRLHTKESKTITINEFIPSLRADPRKAQQRRVNKQQGLLVFRQQRALELC